MNRKLINRIGLLGILALASYAAAMIFSPIAFPGYNWMEQAASDLSADSAPSRHLWSQLSALYETGSVVCATCIAVYVADNKISTRLFRLGIYLFTIMNWVSRVGYQMFALSDAGKDIFILKAFLGCRLFGVSGRNELIHAREGGTAP